ncbi:MAG: alpha-L-fucosidase [Flavobacteriaceae bacterium]|jgi:alpha-L-fucosidase|nr:alpha-L-fucosidase [Flavobacteriaceae bacterium]
MKYLLLYTTLLLVTCVKTSPPTPVGPIPTQEQLNWQKMEFYGFIHFGLNTFTNAEWGFGNTDPQMFNPTTIDTEQWVLTAKKAGMKGLIITAKHHDGFCLWPSTYTDYSVRNSPWKNGSGDVIKELSEACKKYGLKMGIYLSPWDRNHSEYGKPEYISYFRAQLTELLTNYGPLFEIWFDGANGGDGYYGGANEIRYVDKRNYYDWENTHTIIRNLQPDAIIWSDSGPDARWAGNEHGYAYETTWSPLVRDSIYGGMPEYAKKYSMGQENGTYWVPAEADVSIRPGWFYHVSEDTKVKSLKQLLDIYYKSVGQNATLLLNLPINTQGRIHKKDSIQLIKMNRQLEQDFKNNLARNKKAVASIVRGKSKKYDASMVLDDDYSTYWATEEGSSQASLIIDFEQPKQFNRIVIQEYIPLGQRVKKFSIAVENNGTWHQIASHSTIGYKRILRFPKVVAERVKIIIHDAKASPLISTVEVFNAPVIVDEPIIKRNKEGIVTFEIPEKGTSIYYTLNNNEPDLSSHSYKQPFLVSGPTTVKAFSYDPDTEERSETTSRRFDISKHKWTIINASNENSMHAIDDDHTTEYRTNDKEIILDLGELLTIKGFTYTPSQERWPKGIISHFTLFSSTDNKSWHKVKAGEFSNIAANPNIQKVNFDFYIKSQYLKLKIDRTVNHSDVVIVAELNIITKQ